MVNVPLRVQAAVAGAVVVGGIFFLSDLQPADEGASAASGPSPSSSPAAATRSTADFCNDFVAMREVFGEMAVDEPPTGVGIRLREHAERFLEEGPSTEMPPEAEEGFRLLMTSMTTLPDDATMKDLEALDKVLALGDTSGAEAFNEFAGVNCFPP